MLIHPTKPLRTAPGESAEQWLAALADPAWLAAAKVLKEDGGSWVRRATLLGRDVVVKCRPLSSLRKRLQSRLRMGHGDRHWHGAKNVKRAGIRTGEPIVLLRAMIDGTPCEVLVLSHVPGLSLLEHLRNISEGRGPGVRAQHRIAEAAGSTLPALLKARIWNRDHKPSNLIVTALGADHAEVAIIDCVGIKRYGWMGIDEMEAEEMAAALILEPTGCGCPPRRTLWMRALRAACTDGLPKARGDRHAELRLLIGEVESNFAAHGDPTPKINPLRPPRT